MNTCCATRISEHAFQRHRETTKNVNNLSTDVTLIFSDGVRLLLVVLGCEPQPRKQGCELIIALQRACRPVYCWVKWMEHLRGSSIS